AARRGQPSPATTTPSIAGSTGRPRWMASPSTSSICWPAPPPAPRSRAPSKMAVKLDDADGSRRVGTSLAEINIIPLVDVVLVLLLIFMLTAPMMYRGIDVNLPRAAAKPTAVEERLVLTLTKDHALYLNDKRIAPGTLDTSLRAAFQNRTDKTLYLKADSGLAYGAVIEPMDQVRRAGIERLGMVTEPARER